MSQRILCNWFPNWPIQRLVVQRPELRGTRVILFRRDARRGQLVAAVSPTAMQDGVAVGMPVSEAKSLMRRSQNPDSGFHCWEHDPDADLTALETLCDRLESFSPIVGVESLDPDQLKRGRQPSAVLLDITGLAHLFGSEASLIQQQAQHIEQLGYLPRIAVADTVGAAWAAARFLAGHHFRQHGQPLRLPVGNPGLLQRLPVAGLRLDEPVVDTLYQLGVRTLDQLQRLSRRDLAARFGQTIHRRLDQLFGELDEPVEARRKPSPFIASQDLEHPTHHRETIEIILQRLVSQLCRELQADQQGSLEWTVRLNCQQAEPVEFQIKLFQPTATVNHVLPLMEMHLEQALSSVTRTSRQRKVRYTTIEVSEIQVTVSVHVLLVQQQRMLFDDQLGLDRQSLTHLINRLAGRLGAEQVVYPTLQSGAQPEFSYRFKPLVDVQRQRRRKPAVARQQSHRLARPLRLFDPPIALAPPARDSTGPSRAGPGHCLQQLQFRDSRQPDQAVNACWGPERIETGWWRGRTVCRDYWRIEVESGQQFWVFRSLRTGQWWLHGEF